MKRLLGIVILLITILWSNARADYPVEANVEVNLGSGDGNFAPLYLRSNRFGKISQAQNAQIDIRTGHNLDLSKKFDFAWGVEALGGYSNRVDYRKWNSETGEWTDNPQRPALIWLQQLFAEIKWRGLFLSVGLKDRGSYFVDNSLSSGDLIWSGNSRAIPEVRIGFVDFQNIPFTRNFLQFDVCLSYGKFADADWVNSHFDYYNGKRNPNPLWTYKRIALRTNPEKPFFFHAAIQMTGIFGGMTYYYSDGKMTEAVDNYNGAQDFIKILLPFWSDSREGYRVGDTKGTWDFAAQYRFKTGESLRAYVQWPWEDSSGIIKKNGFDGLWGIEFKTGRRSIVTGVVAEYIDLTHMSGPLIYDPNHFNTPENGFNLPNKVGGRDGYYNNSYYRPYVNYGFNMGTPMVQGLLFYTGDEPYVKDDGFLPYFRVRGFHLALSGAIGANFDYVIKYSHRKAWGDTNKLTLIHPTEGDSFMAGFEYTVPALPGLSFGASIAVDHGSMPNNSYGALLTVNYEMFRRF